MKKTKNISEMGDDIIAYYEDLKHKEQLGELNDEGQVKLQEIRDHFKPTN